MKPALKRRKSSALGLHSPALSQPLMRMRRFRRIVAATAITCWEWPTVLTDRERLSDGIKNKNAGKRERLFYARNYNIPGTGRVAVLPWTYWLYRSSDTVSLQNDIWTMELYRKKWWLLHFHYLWFRWIMVGMRFQRHNERLILWDVHTVSLGQMILFQWTKPLNTAALRWL